MGKKKKSPPKVETRGRKRRSHLKRDVSDEREAGTGQYKRKVLPAPIYDVISWVTETEAAEIKAELTGKPVNRTTITRWRGSKYIHGIDVAGTLVMVPLKEVKDFAGIPIGNPAIIKAKMPDTVDPLPKTIRIKLKLRKGNKPPNKVRGKKFD